MIMRDSVTASRIPLDTPVVAGYADGLYAWSPADWARFPTAVRLTIAVSAETQADILDVELGDATPDQVPGWCNRFNRPGRRAPTVYCSQFAWGAVQAVVGSRVVDYWIATLDGYTAVSGAVAVQYVDVGPYDESLILDPTWVATPPSPPEDLMTLDSARLIVWGWYPAILRRTPVVQAEVDYWASRIAGGENAEAVITAFCATPEAVAALKRP